MYVSYRQRYYFLTAADKIMASDSWFQYCGWLRLAVSLTIALVSLSHRIRFTISVVRWL